MHKHCSSRIPSPQLGNYDLIFVICRKLTAILLQHLDSHGIENAQKEMEKRMRDEPESDPVLLLLYQICEQVNLIVAKWERE